MTEKFVEETGVRAADRRFGSSENSSKRNFAPGDGVADGANTVTRACLAEAVHRAVGRSRNEAAGYIEEVLAEIADAIVAGEEVKLSSFGAFQVREKKERLGRNPKTGADATISKRRVVVFKPSNVLRAKINNQRSIEN